MRVLAVTKHGVRSEKLLIASLFLVLVFYALWRGGNSLSQELFENLTPAIVIIAASFLGLASFVYTLLHLYFSRTASLFGVLSIIYGGIIIGLVLGEFLATGQSL